MTTNPQATANALSPGTRERQNALAANCVLWLLATLIAVFFATLLKESAMFDGEYLPRTNDSLYHARRILDAAIGERGFYEFDERLHVGGTWVPWPWGYDYLVAQALRIALWLRPGMDPMAFVSHVPVAWLGVNAALFLACMQALRLNLGMRVVAMLGFSLSPLVQLSHATAMIDHHYIEFTFVLSSLWLGLRWLQQPDNRQAAGLLGLSLGLSLAFHNGLFILQLPLLATIFLLWLRSSAPPRLSLFTLSAALVLSTLLVALPSAAFRAGMFDFALLSWFHVYIAVCSATVLAIMGQRKFDLRSFGILAGTAAVLAIPLIAQVVRGTMFLSGDLYILDSVEEVHSPFRMLIGPRGAVETASLYSWLIVFAPVLFAYFVWRSTTERNGCLLYYSIFAVFALGLLLSQYRFNYFGLVFLISGPIFLWQAIAERKGWRPSVALLGAMVGLMLLYRPALRERLFIIYASGGDTEYADGLAAYHHLAELCAEQPGRVLVNNNDGNAILFHTECSVFVNNFIMRPEDELNHAIVDALMRSTPDDIRRFQPQIDYIFLRARDFTNSVSGEPAIDGRNALARELLLADVPPEGFETTRTIVRMRGDPPAPEFFGRVLKVTPLPPAE
jgi:hypothetical protein